MEQAELKLVHLVAVVALSSICLVRSSSLSKPGIRVDWFQWGECP